jgi:hypothetical protein
MSGTLIPLWIIGGPFIGLLILSFAFKGPSAMSGGRGTRVAGTEPITRLSEVPY